MAYFKDLTPYEYFSNEPLTPKPLNIGWLSVEKPFETGATSQKFKDRLLKFCSDEYILVVTRGLHICEFCNRSHKLSYERWIKKQEGRYGDKAHAASIGNGEIRVLGKSAIYAAPALIYHYVLEHQYQPPDEFIEAILKRTPNSRRQGELLRKYSK